VNGDVALTAPHDQMGGLDWYLENFFVFVFMIEILLAEWKGNHIMTTEIKEETRLLLHK